MSKSTPGPWVAVHQPDQDAEMATVCWCADWCIGVRTPGVPGGNYRDIDWGDPAADARLIAQAPDLLAAARSAEAILARGRWLDTSTDPEAVALRQLRAAIAKAEGRT